MRAGPNPPHFVGCFRRITVNIQRTRFSLFFIFGDRGPTTPSQNLHAASALATLCRPSTSRASDNRPRRFSKSSPGSTTGVRFRTTSMHYGSDSHNAKMQGFVGSKPFGLSQNRGPSVSVCPNSQKYHATKPIRAAAQREADPLTENPLGPPAVLCVGEALYDLFSANPTAEMSDRSQWSPSPGGAPANLAAGLAKLGTGSAFIGNVGDDELGEGLISVLKDYNVNVDGMLKVPGKSTREVFVRRDETGERAFVGFGGVNDEFADACVLDPDGLPGVLFYAAQILVTPTLSLAFPGSRKSLLELVELAKMCKLRIIVDVNWRPVFWDGMASENEARSTILDFVRNADIIKISVEEVEFLYGEDLARRALEQPGDVLRQFGKSVSGVIVTAGSEGAAFAFETGMEPTIGRIAARVPKEGVVDTTGAGDAFLAGFLSEMLKTGGFASLSDPEKVKAMASFGAEVASQVIAAPGSMTPIPTRDMVEATIAGPTV